MFALFSSLISYREVKVCSVSKVLNGLECDRLGFDLRITPFIVDWHVNTTLVDTAICGTSIVVITLSVNDTCSASKLLRALSEPLGLVLLNNVEKLLGKQFLDFSARLLCVGALVRFVVISTRCANINSASISIITTLDVLAVSVLRETYILCARVKVIALRVLDTLFLKDTDTLALLVLGAVSPSILVLVVSVAMKIVVAFMETAFLDSISSSSADTSKGRFSTILVGCACLSLVFFTDSFLLLVLSDRGLFLCLDYALFGINRFLYFVVLLDLFGFGFVCAHNLDILLHLLLDLLDLLLDGLDRLFVHLVLVLVRNLGFDVANNLLLHGFDVSLVGLVLLHLLEGCFVLLFDNNSILYCTLLNLLHRFLCGDFVLCNLDGLLFCKDLALHLLDNLLVWNNNNNLLGLLTCLLFAFLDASRVDSLFADSNLFAGVEVSGEFSAFLGGLLCALEWAVVLLTSGSLILGVNSFARTEVSVANSNLARCVKFLVESPLGAVQISSTRSLASSALLECADTSELWVTSVLGASESIVARLCSTHALVLEVLAYNALDLFASIAWSAFLLAFFSRIDSLAGLGRVLCKGASLLAAYSDLALVS